MTEWVDRVKRCSVDAGFCAGFCAPEFFYKGPSQAAGGPPGCVNIDCTRNKDGLRTSRCSEALMQPHAQRLPC